MNELEHKILEIIQNNDGIKAKEIARQLNTEKSGVNSILYGPLSAFVYQDESYKWHEKQNDGTAVGIDEPETQPDEKLANLCKYYLNCLSLEQTKGVSVYLNGIFSPQYCEVCGIDAESANKNDASEFLRKVYSKRNMQVFLGYPTAVFSQYSSRNREYYDKVEPVFLFPVEYTAGRVQIAQIPVINVAVVKRYSERSSENLIYDVLDLENELGLNLKDVDFDTDDLCARLQSIRNWNWMETIDPEKIQTEIPISEITEKGIFNRAVLVGVEKSPYTQGLESELQKLSKLTEEEYADTALYYWIHRFDKSHAAVDALEIDRLLEVLPLNLEQESAVKKVFSSNLTVITGPPGTGKSQVVTDLLINIAHSGKNALFTSKNNKAVDVVETRVNELGNKPIMMRVGNISIGTAFAAFIEKLINNNRERGLLKEYQRLLNLYFEDYRRIDVLQAKKTDIIKARNCLDELERQYCLIRERWSSAYETLDAAVVSNLVQKADDFKKKHNASVRENQSFFTRLFWFSCKKSREAEYQASAANLISELQKYSISTVSVTSSFYDILTAAENAVRDIKLILDYKEQQKKLIDAVTLEDIDRELLKLKDQITDEAQEVWKKWLNTRSYNFDARTRNDMTDYVSAVQLLGVVDNNNADGTLRSQFERLQKKLASYMPCWAVTSLSAKDRVPFTAGMFDYVIVDEASQCDIASILPLLYRAKRAVIIGDPKQLSHICSITNKQDAGLIEKYGVDYGWSYRVNSLYARAAGITDTEDIIQLRNHHRSYGDIIEFSNKEYYDGNLRIATNYNNLCTPKSSKPGIRWIDVKGQTQAPGRHGACNKAEIAAVIDELTALMHRGYCGTIGVVTPFRAQVGAIGKALEENPELDGYLRRNNDFLVDTVHKFQGDEKDVIIFSSVISNGTSRGAIVFLSNTGNLFNVAVTRARSNLIIVGDKKYCSDCGVPYMEHFVKYCNSLDEAVSIPDIVADYGREYPEVSNPDQVSDWEKYFYTRLYDCGIKTVPQYPVEKYKLDLAVVIDEHRLDIEVDGEMYHKDWNGELCYRDQLRNQRLFELGWDVKRFWVYQIRDETEWCVDQIKQWLRENGYYDRKLAIPDEAPFDDNTGGEKCTGSEIPETGTLQEEPDEDEPIAEAGTGTDIEESAEPISFAGDFTGMERAVTCDTCRMRLHDRCTDLDHLRSHTICDDYQPNIITFKNYIDENIRFWPEYGDATAIRKGDRERFKNADEEYRGEEKSEKTAKKQRFGKFTPRVAGLHWVKCYSRSISAYAYNPNQKCLYVKSKSGRIDYYTGVERNVYRALCATDSKDDFITHMLKYQGRGAVRS